MTPKKLKVIPKYQLVSGPYSIVPQKRILKPVFLKPQSNQVHALYLVVMSLFFFKSGPLLLYFYHSTDTWQISGLPIFHTLERTVSSWCHLTCLTLLIPPNETWNLKA